MYDEIKFRTALLFLFSLSGFSFNQTKVRCFFIVDKGVYVYLNENDKRTKVPFKEKEDRKSVV